MYAVALLAAVAENTVWFADLAAMFSCISVNRAEVALSCTVLPLAIVHAVLLSAARTTVQVVPEIPVTLTISWLVPSSTVA